MQPHIITLRKLLGSRWAAFNIALGEVV